MRFPNTHTSHAQVQRKKEMGSADEGKRKSNGGNRGGAGRWRLGAGRHKLGMLNVPQSFADMTVTNAKHAPQFQTHSSKHTHTHTHTHRQTRKEHAHQYQEILKHTPIHRSVYTYTLADITSHTFGTEKRTSTRIPAHQHLPTHAQQTKLCRTHRR